MTPCLSALFVSMSATWVTLEMEPAETREYAAVVDVSWPDRVASDQPDTRSSDDAKPERLDPPAEPPDPPVPPVAPQRAELDFELSGLIGAVISHRTGGFTFGGPRFGFRVGHFAMGLSFYPSITYSTYREGHRIRPGLGFGLEVAYRGVTLFAPVYHIEDRYVPAFGIGYRFHLVRTIRRRRSDGAKPNSRRRRSPRHAIGERRDD